MNAALGNVVPDNWHWHMYDTIKGSDYLGDQDAIEYMCRAASRLVMNWSTMAYRSRVWTMDAFINARLVVRVRTFGGEQAARTCAAADRTGHAILHALYQQNLRPRPISSMNILSSIY